MKRLFAALITGLFLAGSALADLTVGQMQTLKTLAAADPVAATYLDGNHDEQLGQWFSASTAYIVWRSSLTPDVMREAIVGGAAQLDNLTVGKRDALLYLVSADLRNTATLRATLDDLCGTQNTLKASIVAAEKRAANRAEAALATGIGSTATPGTLTFEGSIDGATASQIRSQ